MSRDITEPIVKIIANITKDIAGIAWRDAINRRLYRKYIRQLFFDRILVYY